MINKMILNKIIKINSSRGLEFYVLEISSRWKVKFWQMNTVLRSGLKNYFRKRKIKINHRYSSPKGHVEVNFLI